MQLKRIRLLHHVFLTVTLFFLTSASFFPFLRVSSLQNDSYQLISSEGTVNYPSPPATSSSVYQFWSTDSYYYKKIKENPKLHPNNDQMIDWLMDYHNDYPGINWASWTAVIYDAYEDTPLYYVKVGGAYKYIPFPDPYPIDIPSDADASVCIIDWYRKDVWHLWNVEATGGTYTSGGGYAYELYGNGVASEALENFWTFGGSGCPRFAACAIRPEEIEAGVINHPLSCSLTTGGLGKEASMTENFVYPPAVHTDKARGVVTQGVIPEGARIQLDPAINLDSLGLSSTGKIIAKCLQDYGVVVCENGGSWALTAEHDLTADWNPPEMSGGLLSPIADLITDSYNPWRVIDFDLYPTVDDMSEYE